MKPKNRLVPGFETHLACSSTGVLVRIHSDNTLTRVAQMRIKVEGKRYASAYLVAKTWHPNPGSPSQLRYRDHDVKNWHPDNLYFSSDPPDTLTRDLTTHVQILEHPELSIDPLGQIWRRLNKHHMKKLAGNLPPRSKTVRIALPTPAGWPSQSTQIAYPAKELVGDILLRNRPSKAHRVHQIDGNPWNLAPSNLRWELPPKPTALHYFYQPIVPRVLRPPEQSLRDAYKHLRASGGRHLEDYPALWALPSGNIVWLHGDGSLTPLVPNFTGYIRTKTFRILARDFIADAFAGTCHAPSLPYPRLPNQKAIPIDGDPQHIHPNNLRWSEPHEREYHTHQFV